MSLPKAFDERVHNAIRDGQYNLILGAGASADAKSADGRPLPLGGTYAAELISAFGLNVRKDTALPYVWEAALAKAGSERALRQRSSVPRFLHCSPASYHLLIPTFAWKRIFTFNVDDVVHAAYKRVERSLQNEVPIHFDQEYRDANPAGDEVQVVYLHGGELFPELPVTFGPPAYAAAAIRHHTWWHVFADAFLSQPVIVIGASLREPDLESYLYLKRRPPTPLLPSSFYVAPEIDDADHATCLRLGLIPIPMKGNAFLEDLSTEVKGRERLSVRQARGVKVPLLGTSTESVHILATIGRQFVVVNDKSSWPSVDRPPEAFYEGQDSTWDDIRADRDVQLRIEQDVLNASREFLMSKDRKPQTRVIVLEGTAGTAKTTALMRIAVAITELKSTVLYFVGKERLRDDVLLQLVSTLDPNSTLALVVDSLADHVRQIRRLIEAYPANAPRCLILGAERSRQKDHIQNNLEGITKSTFVAIPHLSKSEALDLATKLRSAAKLGRFSGRSDQQLSEQFAGTSQSSWAGQLLTILLQVVPGGKFLDRLTSEWTGLGDETSKIFYGCVCLAAAGESPLRSAVAFRAIAPHDGKEVFKKFSGPMRGLITWFDLEWLRPRHRVIAEATVRKCMSASEIFDISLRLGGALAPYVSRSTVMNRTPEARLARRIMDADGIVVPRLKKQAESWFQLLERHWGWNSRFWEQRALVALEEHNYRRARDYAYQAVGLESHPLPMTTCALVNISSAERDPSIQKSERIECLKAGVDLLDQAISRATIRGWPEIHPYHILLTHAVRAARALFDNLPDWLIGRLRAHASEAARVGAKDAQIQLALQGLRRARVI